VPVLRYVRLDAMLIITNRPGLNNLRIGSQLRIFSHTTTRTRRDE
jgi:hypothetical protein